MLSLRHKVARCAVHAGQHGVPQCVDAHTSHHTSRRIIHPGSSIHALLPTGSLLYTSPLCCEYIHTPKNNACTPQVGVHLKYVPLKYIHLETPVA